MGHESCHMTFQLQLRPYHNPSPASTKPNICISLLLLYSSSTLIPYKPQQVEEATIYNHVEPQLLQAGPGQG